MEINKTDITLQPILKNIIQESSAITKPSEEKSDFGGILAQMLQKTNVELLKSEKLSQDYAFGKDVELHQVVLAAEEANMALQLTVQIRNKIVEAYQEITRMQL